MGTERCASCGRQLVTIELTIDGRAHLMSSCSHCNTRRWRRDDSAIDLGGVLDGLHDSIARARSSSRS